MRKRLYRYCSFTPHSVKYLNDGLLVGSTPDTFNDPFDFAFSLEGKELIRNYIIDSKRRHLYCVYNHMDEPGLDLDFFDLDSRFYDETFWDIEQLCMKYILQHYSVVCLSSTWSSGPMWAHYADNYKGFVLSYSTKDIIKEVNAFFDNFENMIPISINDIESFKTQFGLRKIEYTNKNYVGTDEINRILTLFLLKETVSQGLIPERSRDYGNYDMWENYLQSFLSIETAANCINSKRKSWEYEKEYRLIMPNVPTPVNRYRLQYSTHPILFRLQPDEVILGKDMPRLNKEIMFDISQMRRIPLSNIDTYIEKEKLEFKCYPISCHSDLL